MSDRTTFAAGAMTGAAIISIAWIVVSWPTEPPGRHSELYDSCLADGRSTVACDALLRGVLAAIAREKRGKNAEQAVKLPTADEAFPAR
jgi:hypothetical protein